MAQEHWAGIGATVWDAQSLVGRTINQYEVLNILGRGGTAVVFKVLDHETGLHRALKITAAGPSEAELHRFKREFRVMSRLAHPNVIAVYRYGVFETRPYFVMELIEGRDLRAWLRAQADQPGWFEKLAEIFCQVTKALGYIHDRHIIHRDLKPGNILVTHLGQVKVMDFGIAFEVDVSMPAQRAQTLMGTLAYVSPEQATGRKVDARSDLYSVGVILYELLTGVKPFTGATISEVVYKHLHEMPRSPRDLRPDLPPALIDLALDLLAKRPHERPQSAQEVQLALETFLAHGRVPDLEPSALEIVAEKPPLNEARFVGRSTLFDELRARVARLKAGRGGLAMIIGEGGLGKSRFLEELARDDDVRGLQVFQSRCLAQSTSPYQGIRDIVVGTLLRLIEQPGGLGGLLTDPQRAALCRAFPQLQPQLQQVPEPTEGAGPGGGDWLNLFTGVRTVLERLSESAPLLLLFDDLDRADEASLALLQALVRSMIAGARPKKLFIVGTSRPDALLKQKRTGASLTAGLSSTHSTVVNQLGKLQSIFEMVGFVETPLLLYLDPFTLEEVQQMVSSMLGHSEDPAGLAEYLHQQADGNPYFVEATLRALVEEGLLQRRDHTATGCEWTMHLEQLTLTTSIQLPIGLQGALRKRLSLLDPRDLMVLQVAATIGEPFRYELLREVAGLDEDSMLDFLDRMLKAHLLVEREGDGYATYDFSHARARELVLNDLPRGEQVLLHRQIGQVLSRRVEEGLAAITAHHLFEGRLYDDALPFLLTAGERFIRQQLYRLAMRPLSRAEEILTRYRVPLEGRDDTPLKLRLHHGSGQAHLGLGRTDEAFDHLTKAVGLFTSETDKALESVVRTNLGHVHRERGEYRPAREQYEAALDALQQAGQSHKMGDTILGLGEILTRQGLFARALDVYAQARELAMELQHRPGIAAATLGLGEVAALQGNSPEALRRSKDALNTFRWLEDRPMIVQALQSVSVALRLSAEYAQALEAIEEALMMAREYDLRSRLASLLTCLGQIYLDLNAPTQAEGALTEAINLCTRHGYTLARAEASTLWGILREQAGEFPAALESYRQGLKLAQGIAAQVLTGRLLTQVARLQLKLGETQGARKLSDKAIHDLRNVGAQADCAEAWLVGARVRLQEGDVDAALAAAEEGIRLAEALEARDLCFRALVTRMQLSANREGGGKKVGVLRAAGLLHWMLEGAGTTWRSKLLRRKDVAQFCDENASLVGDVRG